MIPCAVCGTHPAVVLLAEFPGEPLPAARPPKPGLCSRCAGERGARFSQQHRARRDGTLESGPRLGADRAVIWRELWCPRCEVTQLYWPVVERGAP